MFFQALVDHCSPTLAGIKTGSLFPLHGEGEDVAGEIRRLNRVLVRNGLRMIPVRRDSRPTLIYVYRPDRLKRDLALPEAEEILREKGYPCGSADGCVSCLIRHLQCDAEFPHEIGLFLSYPPSDVHCFMRDALEGVRCVGCWKAYSNAQEAERTFERFKRCTDIYRTLAKKGRTLEQLIVRQSGEKAAACP